VEPAEVADAVATAAEGAVETATSTESTEG
jgi:hypothetical protein